MNTPFQSVLLAVLAAAVGDAQPGPKPNDPSEKPAFSLTIAAQPRIAKVGTEVKVSILLTNTSSRNVELKGLAIDWGQARDDEVDVRDAQGNVLPRKEFPPEPGRHVFQIYDVFVEPRKFASDYIRLDNTTT